MECSSCSANSVVAEVRRKLTMPTDIEAATGAAGGVGRAVCFGAVVGEYSGNGTTGGSFRRGGHILEPRSISGIQVPTQPQVWVSRQANVGLNSVQIRVVSA